MQREGGLYWHDVHTKFHENPSAVSKAATDRDFHDNTINLTS